jgi:hypothetical protein
MGGAGSSLTGTGTGGFLNTGTGAGASGFLTGGTSALGGFINTGTGMTGVTGTGARGTGGTASGGVSSTNPLSTFYVNPMALGLGTGTSQPRFGAPLYNITSTGQTGTGATRGGTATLSSTSSTTVPNFPGATSMGVRRAPAYVTTIGFDYPQPSVERVQARAQDAIARASKLASRDSILVAMDGETLVLRGSAANERERRLAESLLRMTPGVYEVRNELEIRETAPAPRRIP